MKKKKEEGEEEANKYNIIFLFYFILFEFVLSSFITNRDDKSRQQFLHAFYKLQPLHVVERIIVEELVEKLDGRLHERASLDQGAEEDVAAGRAQELRLQPKPVAVPASAVAMIRRADVGASAFARHRARARRGGRRIQRRQDRIGANARSSQGMGKLGGRP